MRDVGIHARDALDEHPFGMDNRADARQGFHTIGSRDSVSEQTKVANAQFKPGDTVSLRSGGPLMTIAMVDGQAAFCEWFTNEQQPQSRSFALTSLKLDEHRHD